MTSKNREELTAGDIVGEGINVLIMALMVNFFMVHQAQDTGFLTEDFGTTEMIYLYGPMLLGFASPVIRAFTARRNPGRPFEAATHLFLAIAAMHLLRVFPFDFSHFGDVLPWVMRAAVAWVPDVVGRIALIIQMVVGGIAAMALIIKFFFVLWADFMPSPQHPAV